MELVSLILIALGLSADCFAVSISIGANQRKFFYSHMIRIALAFGLFQFIMPIIGWLVGNSIVVLISDYDHWLAFILLVGVGGRMIWEYFRKEDEVKRGVDISRLPILLLLAVATSIDALAVGLSLALLATNIIYASAIIGVMAFIITSTGFFIGKKVSKLLGLRAKLAGGIILILIGIRILIEHLL